MKLTEEVIQEELEYIRTDAIKEQVNIVSEIVRNLNLDLKSNDFLVKELTKLQLTIEKEMFMQGIAIMYRYTHENEPKGRFEN